MQRAIDGVGFQPKQLRRRGTVRRAALLEAAAIVFLEKGYEGASLSDIVARAGGSRRLIYDQFRDKEGLFEAMMTQRCAQMLDPLDDGEAPVGAPAEILYRLGLNFMRVMVTTNVQAIRRIVMSEGGKFPRIAEIFFSAGVDPVLARARACFTRLDQLPGLRFDEPHMAAVMFMSMVQADAVERLTAGAPEQPDWATIERQIGVAVQIVLAYGVAAAVHDADGLAAGSLGSDLEEETNSKNDGG